MLSSRVRTGRSISGYSLPPHCTRAERRAVERIVVDALKGLTGEFQGKYYPLSGMTEKEQDQLIEVGFTLDMRPIYRIFTKDGRCGLAISVCTTNRLHSLDFL